MTPTPDWDWVQVAALFAKKMQQPKTLNEPKVYFSYALHTIFLLEVSKVGKDVNKNSENSQREAAPQDEMMNKVNQTFDEMVQDVRNLINENDKESNMKQS